MNTFEYVSVIFTVVVSLAFTHLLAGVVRLIQTRGVKFSFVHASWIALLVFCCVDYWFSIWHLRDAETWTLGFVAFLLLMATVLYVACGLALPREGEVADGLDLNAFYLTNRRRFLSALFVYQLLSIFGNLAIAPLQLAGLVNVGLLLVIAAAWTWPDRRIQMAAVALMTLITAWYAVTFIGAL